MVISKNNFCKRGVNSLVILLPSRSITSKEPNNIIAGPAGFNGSATGFLAGKAIFEGTVEVSFPFSDSGITGVPIFLDRPFLAIRKINTSNIATPNTIYNAWKDPFLVTEVMGSATFSLG